MTVRDRIVALEAAQIQNDRQLLKALDLSEALAGRYLGRSRQALNNKLQDQDGWSPNNYFRLGDIIVLVLAARQRGTPLDREAVLKYARDRPTRSTEGDVSASLYLLEQLLNDQAPMRLDEARLVIFLMPSFETLQVDRPETTRRLRGIVDRLTKSNRKPRMLLMESTPMRAAMASQWLGLPEKTGVPGGQEDVPAAQSNSAVDHYLPTILVYGPSEADIRPYVLNDTGDFLLAPQCNAAMMATCIQYMLDEKARTMLLSLPTAPIEPVTPPEPADKVEDPEALRVGQGG